MVDSLSCEERESLTIQSKQECVAAGHKAGLTNGGSGDDWLDYMSKINKKDGGPCGCIGIKPGELYFNGPGQCTQSTTCHPTMNCVCASKGITNL